MSTQLRTTLIAVAAGIGLIVAAAIVIPRLLPQGAAGQELYELQGVTVSASYSTAGTVPAVSAPVWFPATATDIHLKKSGPQAKQHGRVLLDAVAPAGFALPTDCSSGNTPFPWDNGWSGVDTTQGVRCGAWSALLVGHRLYTWK